MCVHSCVGCPPTAFLSARVWDRSPSKRWHAAHPRRTLPHSYEPSLSLSAARASSLSQAAPTTLTPRPHADAHPRRRASTRSHTLFNLRIRRIREGSFTPIASDCWVLREGRFVSRRGGGTPRRRSGTPRTSPIARRACEGARDGSDPSPRFADETDDARAPAGSTLAAHGETLASLTERTRVTARRLSKEIMTSVRRISKEVMDALLLA